LCLKQGNRQHAAFQMPWVPQCPFVLGVASKA